MSNAAPTNPAATRHEPPPRGASLDRFGSVTSGAKRNLETYVALLFEWQRTHNLVSSATLDTVWTRHVADSAQLLDHAPSFREWIDLGSGAGFPGLVVAIACNDSPDRHFTLVESNGKKAAFLRAAIRSTGANATVANERIEAHGKAMRGRGDIVSARALKPLSELLALAAPYCHAESTMLFLKGQDYSREIDVAAQSFAFDVIESPSATESGGYVLAIRNLRSKAGRP